MDERKRIIKNEKQGQEPRGKERSLNDRTNERKGNDGSIDIDNERDAWISESPRSSQGEYTSRYHEE